jgi:hypothetical protein
MYHRHKLTECRIRDAQLVDHSRQNERNAPSANAMGDPYHEERYERRILEETYCLLDIEGFSTHGWCLLGQITEHSFTLVFGEEFDSLGIVW